MSKVCRTLERFASATPRGPSTRRSGGHLATSASVEGSSYPSDMTDVLEELERLSSKRSTRRREGGSSPSSVQPPLWRVCIGAGRAS